MLHVKLCKMLKMVREICIELMLREIVREPCSQIFGANTGFSIVCYVDMAVFNFVLTL